MIVYQSTKKEFLDHVLSGEVEQVILHQFKNKFQRNTSPNEIAAWRNSMLYMDKVLSDDEIPMDTGIAIECQIPQTAKRIDFIISGVDSKNQTQIVIIELKQWTSASMTSKDGIVKTIIGGGLRETSHPSYQAWSYARLLEDFSETVQDEKMPLSPCAFLHNYDGDNAILDSFYQYYLDKAPVFLKKDMVKLREFIKRFVKRGDNGNALYRIEKGRIRPSKQLSESLSGMLKGKQEFVLIDEQKLIYESALELAEKSNRGGKHVLIVEGGPGTGKSVVAINLLVQLISKGLNAQYVSKNAAPRAVYQARLEGSITKKRFSSLFKGSGSYVDCPPNIFDALIVDESHRLNEKSGMYSNEGENQVKEIINASKFSIFFIDENQKVTIKDIGTKDELFKWCKYFGAEVSVMELSSQFRCNGSDGYLAWLDHVLQIRDTANITLSDIPYDFRVVNTPSELRGLIYDKNQINNKARLVAGYCWDWVSKNDTKKQDIFFPEHGFAMPWNFATESYLWSIKPDSVGEIGCIHTCQGLELDYVGVIIGKDLVYKDDKVMVDPSKRARTDASLKGYKKQMQSDPIQTQSLVRDIIKNTYRTLMARGMKGCYIWCEDQALADYFRKTL
ncbi:MAG: DNA/RNA helicase domain-containing protein [Arcticibacter sp.]